MNISELCVLNLQILTLLVVRFIDHNSCGPLATRKSCNVQWIPWMAMDGNGWQWMAMASMDGKLLSIFLFKNFGIYWLLQASLIDCHFQVSASRLSNIHRELTVQHQKDFWHLPEQSCHVRERSLRWGGLTHRTGAKGIARGIAALLENLAETKRAKPWSLRRKPGSWDSHPVHNECICCMQSYLPKKTLCQHAASSLPVWQCQASKTTKININDTSQVQCTENKTKRKQMSCRSAQDQNMQGVPGAFGML